VYAFAATAALDEPLPAAFTARITKLYVVPSERPDTAIGDDVAVGLLVVHVEPPLLEY